MKITQAKLRKILFQILFLFLTISAATHIAVEKSSDSLTMLNYVKKYIKVVDHVLHNLRKATFLFLCFFKRSNSKFQNPSSAITAIIFSGYFPDILDSSHCELQEHKSGVIPFLE